MRNKITFGRPLILHPLFFAIYPFLFLFSFNLTKGELVRFSSFLPFILISIGITVFLLFILSFFLGNGKKAGILVSLILALFFLYGHSVIYLVEQGLFSDDDNSMGLYPFWAVFFLISVICIVRTKSNLNNLTFVLNITASVLLLFPLYNITAYKFQKWTSISEIAQEDGIELKRHLNMINTPDIFYIILDGYAGQSVLKYFYDFDNQHFIDLLKERHFYVATNSISNYPSTLESMASSLNMVYLTDRGDSSENMKMEGIDDKELQYNDLPSNYNVIKILESYGYEFIRIDINELRNKKIVNHKILGIEINETLALVLQTTLLRGYISEIMADAYREDRRSVFKEVSSSRVLQKSPKFVLGHIMMPHPPFVFGPDGEERKKIKWGDWGIDVWADKTGYINQLIYVNKLTINMIDQILANSEDPPIIIIQGDHGPASFQKSNSSWINPDDYLIKERTSILNTYFLPNGDTDLLYDSITPVNTFRVVLNSYFGRNYVLLNDKSFWGDVYMNRESFSWFDVTESAKKDIVESEKYELIFNGDFTDDLKHWRLSTTDGGHITWSDGELQFIQGEKDTWIHAFQNTTSLTAGEKYKISIKTIHDSLNLRLGFGTSTPDAGKEYLGTGTIGTKNYAQISTKKQYLFNIVPLIDGPHYLVISNKSSVGQISKIDDVKFVKSDNESSY